MAATSSTIESEKDFKSTPAGLQEKWTIEISAAKEQLKKWWEQSEKANKRYLGESDGPLLQDSSVVSRINLFHANINILLSILFGLSCSALALQGSVSWSACRDAD